MNARRLDTATTAARGAVCALTILGLVFGVRFVHANEPVTAEQLEFFESRIRPVLVDHCHSCHSATADRIRGGLRLDTREAWRKGGDSGPAVVPGDPEASLLIEAVRYTNPDLEMPPKGQRLSPAQIADLETWVRWGAPDPRGAESPTSAGSTDLEKARSHWAFQPVIKPAVPAVRDATWGRNAIDAFVLSGLEAAGLAPAPAADGRTLLRRVTYDLTGLPPSPDEMDAFLGDPSADAYERAVDRLLASARYGERWGRYWLDVARYADTKGYVFQEERRYAFAYTYRDYVIDSLNADKPYDRFVLEQLAADQLDPGDDPRALAAMGFLTLGRRFLNNANDIIDDRIDVTMRGLQGLTVSCARCHDHKFDPIPIRDYYSLHGVFASSEEPAEKPVLPGRVDPADQALYVKEQARLEEAIAQKTDEEVASYRSQLRERRGDYEQAAKEVVAQGGAEVLAKIAAERNLVPQVLERGVAAAGGGGKDPFELPKEQVLRLAEVRLHEATAPLRNELSRLDVTHAGAPSRAMVLVDRATPVQPRVFIRGNPGNRGPEVPRQFLEILGGPDRKPFTQGSGRLELARAIASEQNPLTARVMVNRVWLGHFGQALVRTPSDFGVRTEAPPHRELLDYLAATFMEHGWSLKRLHRLIVLSSSYRQSTRPDAEAARADPGNHLVWRMNPRRLDFEAMRDTLLAAGGNLDLTAGGRPGEITGDAPSRRRTIYGFIDRQNLPGLFRTFDFANPDSSSPQRFSTTVPQQALFLMNAPLVAEQARQLVRRPEVTAAGTDPERLQRLHRLVYQRPAGAED
ncbi:MAG: DUF1553 domain-containing protein, partial [Limisphaerales bacterium]